MRLDRLTLGLGAFLVACGSRGEESKTEGGLARGSLGGLKVYDKSSGTTLKPDAKGALVLHVFPPSQDDCLPEIAELEATANGKAMTVESKFGSKTRVNLAHGETFDESCHAIDAWIDKVDIPTDDGATVTFVLSDGDAQLEIVWAKLFEARKLVLDSKSLRIGDSTSASWNIDEDELTPSKDLAVCFRPPASEKEACALGPNDCAPAKLDGRTLTFTVPQSWGCAARGGLFARGLSARSSAQKCDERVKQCVAAVAPSDVEVEIAK